MGGMGFPMGVPISSYQFHPALRQELEEEYSQAEAGFVFFGAPHRRATEKFRVLKNNHPTGNPATNQKKSLDFLRANHGCR